MSQRVQAGYLPTQNESAFQGFLRGPKAANRMQQHNNFCNNKMILQTTTNHKVAHVSH